jgi:uncharacterized damage-inducible protein DinB
MTEARVSEDLRYPIGKFVPPLEIAVRQRYTWISEIEILPAKLRKSIAKLDDEQLATPYREGGWTIRQVVHHLPDSHLNSYGRFRLALTEDSPTIKPYREDAWANLPDAKSAPVELSLNLLDALHGRWVILLRSMDEDQFRRVFEHPEVGQMSLGCALALYAWHGRHHLAHIENLCTRRGWSA